MQPCAQRYLGIVRAPPKLERTLRIRHPYELRLCLDSHQLGQFEVQVRDSQACKGTGIRTNDCNTST